MENDEGEGGDIWGQSNAHSCMWYGQRTPHKGSHARE